MRSLSLRQRLAAPSALLLLLACDPPPPATDAGMDTNGSDVPGDAGGSALDTLPVSETLDLPGFEGDVSVVYDDRGVPHIYGTTIHDVIMAEGFLMSRDRFGQMEFIRRSVLGRLAEVAAALSPALPEDDFDSRVQGYARMGRLIWEDLQDATDPVDIRTREVAQAFVDGVNAYIARVRTGDENPAFAGADALLLIINNTVRFTDWEPADVFAMARFQAASLSFDAGADVGRTRALAGIEVAFGAADDPRRAMFHDVMGDLPARAVYTRDGFNDGTTSAFLPDFGSTPDGRDTRPRVRGADAPRPTLAALDAADAYFHRLEARFMELGMGDEHRGSNNWLVAGEHTASGNPILSNDPHLSLISPPVWWYVHLNTAHMGGEDAVDAEGVAFAGLPGVVLGFNRNIAWGATTTGYDVTDVYLEQVTVVDDGPDTVEFEGEQVAIVSETETIFVAGEGAVPLVRDIDFVPHHGPILPGTATEPDAEGHYTALSVRYTGYDVSNELAYFTALLTAENVEEAATAQDHFRVGSQNFIVIDRDDIRWSTESRVPVRDPRALTFAYEDDGTFTGASPLMVLDGTGIHEWMGDLPETVIPHDQNPARGWIATANQDNVGVTDDGNPCNDEHYIGGDFDSGWRQDHIVGELERLVTRGDITVEDMQALQAFSRSSTGAALRDRFVEILGDADAITEAGVSPADATRLADARTRLMAWTLETPHGVGATDAAVIADSTATAIFNAALTHTLTLALGDEGNEIGRGVSNDDGVRWLEQALVDPSVHEALTAEGRSVFFDDLTTDGEVETEETIVIRGTLAGLNFLASAVGAEATSWRWGVLHRVRFTTVVPVIGTDILSIPPADDDVAPTGFPRHGDWGAVDVGNFRMFARPASEGGARVDDFMHGSGASQRLVVEMTPTGPRAFNALPGGQVYDPESPHHRDEADLWIANEAPALAFDEADIVTHFERRIVLGAP